MMRHIVLFKYTESCTAADQDRIAEAFANLKPKIPLIRQLDWGTNISPEGRGAGFHHCFHLVFQDEADRDAYLVHPEHVEFGESVGDLLEDVLVFDFEF
jgi:hypothetical protein